MMRLSKILHFGFGSFLEDDEEVYYAFRQPFIFAMNKITMRLALYGGLSLFLWWFFGNVEPFVFGTMFVMAFALYKVLGAFFYWYFNAVLLTTEGVTFVDWPKYFEKTFIRIDYHNLDEISVEKRGVKSFAMNYGTLIFQKVNGGEPIEVKFMNRPNRVARIVEKHREAQMDHKNFTEESALKDLISQLVITHVKKNGQPERGSGEEVQRGSGLAGEKGTQERMVEELEEEVEGKREKKFLDRFKKKPKPRFEDEATEVEKTFDDEGGLEIDLDEKRRD